MKRAISWAVLLVALTLGGPTALQAADRAIDVRSARMQASVLPFPRGDRAEAVWASGGCWTACTAQTTWTMASCLSFDSQGRCIARADADDRACQRTCRSRGGPYLAIE